MAQTVLCLGVYSMELAKLVADCVGSEILVTLVLFLPLEGSIGLE